MEEHTTNHKPLSQLLTQMMFEKGWSNAAVHDKIAITKKEDGKLEWPDPPNERSIAYIRQGRYDKPKKKVHASMSLAVVAQFMIKTAEEDNRPELAEQIRKVLISLSVGPDQTSAATLLAQEDQVQPSTTTMSTELAYQRLHALCPPLPAGMASYSEPVISALGAWAGVDIRWTISVMEGSKRFYEEVKMDVDAIARLNLSLGLAYREWWASSQPTRRNMTYLIKAKECLTSAIAFFELNDLYKVNFLERAIAHDRIGMVMHLEGQYDIAKHHYSKAKQAIHGKKELPARLMGAWAELNNIFLLLDYSQYRTLDSVNDAHARTGLLQAMITFRELKDFNALWHVIAAAGCYSFVKEDDGRANAYIDALPSGDKADVIGPTYFLFTDKARSGKARNLTDAHISQHHFANDSLETILEDVSEWLTTLDGQLVS